MKRLTLLLPLFYASWLPANDCQPQKIDLWAQADYAMSGSQVIIEGKRFKLIGIESPQIEKKQKFFTAGQPMAKESQTKLNKLLANHDLQVGIEYDRKKIDSFGRQLAHLYIKDKQGQITSLQAMMLQSGLALAATHPPNLKHQQCYYQAEAQARDEKLMLWDLAKQHPELHYPLVKSSEIYAEDTGYRLVKGKVLKVEKSRNNYIINLDTTGIRIRKEEWSYFDYYQLQKLKGKTIEVRGVPFHYKGAMFIVIDHPNAIDLLRNNAK